LQTLQREYILPNDGMFLAYTTITCVGLLLFRNS